MLSRDAAPTAAVQDPVDEWPLWTKVYLWATLVVFAVGAVAAAVVAFQLDQILEHLDAAGTVR